VTIEPTKVQADEESDKNAVTPFLRPDCERRLGISLAMNGAFHLGKR
jgi:hypothetical protein